MYLSFVCGQRTIRCVRVTFDGVVLQQYHTYQVDNIPICKFCNTKYTFSVFTRRWRIALENACSILTGKAELYVCGDPPNKNRDCHCLLHVESHAQTARSFSFSPHYFYFPAQLVGGFTLSDLLDKPWSQASSLLPPPYVPSILIAHRVQHSHCLSIFIECC